MVSRIKENQNWRKILCYKRDATSNSKKEVTKKHIFIIWKNLSSGRICLQNLGVHELIKLR